MARDVEELLANQPVGSLPPHPLEHISLDLIDWSELPEAALQQKLHDFYTKLLKVYLDDFIGLIQMTNLEELWHYTQALMHAIYLVPPPPDITKDPGEDPISHKNA